MLDAEPIRRVQGWLRAPERRAALTFDDGPNGACTEALLDLLGEYDVVATFCVVGSGIASPGGARILRRTVAEGHALANHALTFADMGDWPAERVRADLGATTLLIHDAVGDDVPVRWFRAPNGSWGRTAEVAVRLGMQPLAVVHTIDDWRTQDVPTLVGNLRAALTPGELLVAHDGGGDRSGTVAALRQVLPEWLAEGWSFTFPAGP